MKKELQEQAEDRADNIYPESFSNPEKSQCHFFGREGFIRGFEYGIEDKDKEIEELKEKVWSLNILLEAAKSHIQDLLIEHALGNRK